MGLINVQLSQSLGLSYTQSMDIDEHTDNIFTSCCNGYFSTCAKLAVGYLAYAKYTKIPHDGPLIMYKLVRANVVLKN